MISTEIAKPARDQRLIFVKHKMRPSMKLVIAKISPDGIKSKIKLSIMTVAIVAGIAISQAATAQRNFHKSKVVHNKIKYKVQVHKSDKVCDILNKKRNYVAKGSFFASNRKSKNKPMAEVDSPGARKEVVSLN
jgi:uncharacterized protein (DUF111 family)